MSIDNDIRATLRRTADAAAAPPVHDSGFGRRVRRYRIRRRARLTAVVAAVSPDGTRLAFTTPNDDLVVYDLVADAELERRSHDQLTYVYGYGDEVLYSVGEAFWFGTGAEAIEVPGDPGWDASAGGSLVNAQVTETVRFFEVHDGAARPIGSAPDVGGMLSPDGRYYARSRGPAGTRPIGCCTPVRRPPCNARRSTTPTAGTSSSDPLAPTVRSRSSWPRDPPADPDLASRRTV